ncbi:AT-hook motif nuclear-localized protein 8-like [Impatiens glandulifera]|uniref:AT-hook motif nuclear-localized protein 8-like n=1 Tax=Impatiens glandulifera TaxID=253017 RepID=UPI001FB0CF96|nr:AT-hook motif nuclear-localized protein 8-like [Impatiens glandulifera]
MDSRESNQLHQSSQSQMQSQPQMMLGAPNSYAHGLINGGASSGMMPPISAAAAMMQNHPFSLNSAGQSASMEVGNLNPQFAGGSMTPNGPSPFNIDQGRKKRGRPRKYSPENNINLGLASDSGPSLTPASAFTSNAIVAIHDEANVRTPASESSAKKHRGRPPSSGKKQLDALGSFGIGFTPHVIFVEAGEDIAAKIMAFSREGPRTVCIMSAHGAISKATLIQSSTSSGIISYEGRFEIISLTGAFMPSEGNIGENRMSPLSVSLAGSDGRVLGGGVGKLIAANTIQVIVGSFIADGKKPKPGFSPTPSNVQEFGARTTVAGGAAEGNTPSEGHSSDSSHDEDGSPYDNSSVPPSGPPQGPPQFNNSARPVHNMTPYSHLDWGNTTMKMFHN